MMAHAWAIQVMCLPHVLSPGQLSITVGHSGQIKRFLLSLSAKEPNYNSVPGTATAATAAHHDWSLPHNVGWMKSVGGLSIVTVRRLWHKRTRLSFLAGVTALWKAPLCWLFLPACPCLHGSTEPRPHQSAKLKLKVWSLQTCVLDPPGDGFKLHICWDKSCKTNRKRVHVCALQLQIWPVHIQLTLKCRI